MTKKKFNKLVIQSLRNNPEDWTDAYNGYRINNKKLNISIWIPNGFWFYNINEYGCRTVLSEFAFFEKLSIIVPIAKIKLLINKKNDVIKDNELSDFCDKNSEFKKLNRNIKIDQILKDVKLTAKEKHNKSLADKINNALEELKD